MGKKEEEERNDLKENLIDGYKTDNKEEKEKEIEKLVKVCLNQSPPNF